MKTRKIIYKNNQDVFFTLTDLRTFYYRGKINNKKIVNKVRISKDKMFKDITRAKKSLK